MTTRTPLVVVNGQTQQMPVGDTVPLTHGGTGATTAGDALTALGAVPSTRTLTMTAPLTGGGDLSENLTLGLSYDTTLQVVGGALGVSSLVALATHTHSQYVTSAGSVAYATNAGSVTNGAYTNVANTFSAAQTATSFTAGSPGADIPAYALRARGGVATQFNSANLLSGGFEVYKRGTTGDATAAIAANTQIGYNSFFGWNGTAYTTGGYILVRALEAFSATASGSKMSFIVRNTGSGGGDREILTLYNGRVHIGADIRTSPGDLESGEVYKDSNGFLKIG